MPETPSDSTSSPESPRAALPRIFAWPRDTTPAERQTLVAGGLGWMLDAMDVMLYSLVLAFLIREFAMDTRTAGFLNSLTLVASAIGGSKDAEDVVALVAGDGVDDRGLGRRDG